MKAKCAVLFSLAVFAATGQASNTYRFTGSAGGDPQNATAQFTIGNCMTSYCQLNIVITNDVTSPNDMAQGIIGLSFNIGDLTTAGTLNLTTTNGSGGKVPEIYLPSGSSAGSTNSTPEWTFGYAASSNPGCKASGAFCLDGHSLGGAPQEMIIGLGASGGVSNESHFDLWLAGPVDFEIDHFARLTSSTTFSNVKMDFGTGPDSSLVGSVCTDCGGTTHNLVPEPLSLFLVGSGLALLGLVRFPRRQ